MTRIPKSADWPESSIKRADRIIPPFEIVQKSRHFTAREIEILELLLEGFRLKGVADQLGLSEGTVKVYVVRMRAKTNSPTTIKLVVDYALRKERAHGQQTASE
jgi:DNA-binding NarL/FixJ family response regulator